MRQSTCGLILSYGHLGEPHNRVHLGMRRVIGGLVAEKHYLEPIIRKATGEVSKIGKVIGDHVVCFSVIAR